MLTRMKPFVAISLAAILLAGCRKTETVVTETSTTTAGSTATAVTETTASLSQGEDYLKEIEAWHKRRDEGLRKEDSWLTLVGLHWLSEGANRFGSAKSGNDIVLPKGAPEKAGVLSRAGEKVTLTPIAPMTIDAKPVSGETPLANDSEENGPTIVQMGSMRFQIIKRGDRIGVRVKDAQAETRTHFQGLEYFPTDPKWRVEAHLEPYNPPKNIPITDVTGVTSDNPSPGALVFTIDGKEYRIDPIIEEGSDEYFLIFRDETSKDSTYPAGRYLYTRPAGPDGKVMIDFNRAYNPPCAFTPFATCPLPPQQNRLAVRIEAGEKKYAGH